MWNIGSLHDREGYTDSCGVSLLRGSCKAQNRLRAEVPLHRKCWAIDSLSCRQHSQFDGSSPSSECTAALLGPAYALQALLPPPFSHVLLVRFPETAMTEALYSVTAALPTRQHPKHRCFLPCLASLSETLRLYVSLGCAGLFGTRISHTMY